jgi:hypothetical protein
MVVAGIGAVCLVSAAVLSTVRRPGSIVWLRHLLLPSYLAVSLFLFATMRMANLINEKLLSLKIGEDTLDDPYKIWLTSGWNRAGAIAAIAIAILCLAAHFISMRRRVIAAYASADERVSVEKRNVAYHNNMDGSVIVHALLIIVLPVFLQMHGCGPLEYALPGGGGGGGGGGPQQQQVIKVVKKQQKRRKHFSRPNSAITFYVPKMDESEVAKVVDLATENTLVANPNDVNLGNGTGGPGSGFGAGGGSGGGWPGGDPNAVVRFLRLQYNCTKWNDGFDDGTRADGNFLDELHKVSHLKTSDHGEAVTAEQLRRFKKGSQPPFLFMTGEANFDMPDAECKVIRQYCLDGGMIFADCGEESWDNAFDPWCRKVFPEHKLLDISNDDDIFKAYYFFPSGAPGLWQHRGNNIRSSANAMGVKHDGRWVIFYFRGDMNDAWKSGHNGASQAVWDQSFRLGINVVKYAIDHYWAMNRKK